eukprot:3502092-Pyramimonas_sp.AAC.1
MSCCGYACMHICIIMRMCCNEWPPKLEFGSRQRHNNLHSHSFIALALAALGYACPLHPARSFGVVRGRVRHRFGCS